MNRDLFEEFFARTLDDGRLSRSEARCFKELLVDAEPSAEDKSFLRNRIFDLAHKRLGEDRDPARLLDWTADIVKALYAADAQEEASLHEAWFFPDSERKGLERLLGLVASARESLDICVFTITHNDISDALLRAHKRGVKVRIISDDDKAHDLGSDVHRLGREGVPVRIDLTDAHMHHKFAVVDGQILVNGSFNWTRSAARNNHENLQITNHPRQVARFQERFRLLWERFGG